MNLNFSSLFASLPGLVIAVEQALPAKGSGADKLAAVLSTLTSTLAPEQLPEFMRETWPRVQGYVSALIAFYNFVGFFKKERAA